MVVLQQGHRSLAPERCSGGEFAHLEWAFRYHLMLETAVKMYGGSYGGAMPLLRKADKIFGLESRI